MSFDSNTEVLMPLHRRGTFDMTAFADKCNAEIPMIRKGGSKFYSAVLETMKSQSSRDEVTTVVAITDGEATDAKYFKDAHKFLGETAAAYDVKLLMVSHLLSSFVAV